MHNKIPDKTTLQKTVTKQRLILKEMLFESMSELALACSQNIDDSQALEKILTDAMGKADYCKYIWVLDRSVCQLTDTIDRVRYKTWSDWA